MWGDVSPRKRIIATQDGFLIGKFNTNRNLIAIVAEWTSLSVKRDTKQRFKDAKETMDSADPATPDMTADQFLNTLLDTLEHANDGGYSDPVDGPFPEVEVSEIAEETARKFDYAELANRMAEELEGRMR